MASGFTFGGTAPQPQQPQQNTSLFGTGSTPLAAATPIFGAQTVTTGGAPGLFGAAPANTTSVPSSFSFSSPTPAQRQQQPQTGFSLGSVLAAPTTSAPGTGFSFAGGNVQQAVVTAAPAVSSTAATGTTSFGGLGGIPSTGIQRVSTLALGTDPTTGWAARTENRALQELPVPPEIIAAVEELKIHMKNQKSILSELNRSSDLELDSVTEQIEEVRMGISSLLNMMHKQELMSASIVKDIAELSKNIDLLSQARDIPAYGYGGHNLLNFLYNVVDNYGKRMMNYKAEIERAENSLQTIMGTLNTNAKDLWDSFMSTKDSVLFFAAQIQELHEELRNELNVHKNICQVVYGQGPRPWLSEAMSGNLELSSVISPLEKVFAHPCPSTKRVSSSSSLESVVKRTYSMFSRVPSIMDSRVLPPQSETFLGSPSRSASNMGSNFTPSYHSSMGFMGPSSPASNCSLKRSKK